MRIYRTYVNDSSIRNKAMLIMGSFLGDVRGKSMNIASKLMRLNKTKTMTTRDLAAAVHMAVPSVLGQPAHFEGTLHCQRLHEADQKEKGSV